MKTMYITRYITIKCRHSTDHASQNLEESFILTSYIKQKTISKHSYSSYLQAQIHTKAHCRMHETGRTQNSNFSSYEADAFLKNV